MILQLIGKAKRGIKRLVAPDAAKRDAEMQYWRQKQREENQLSHDHYSYFYTDFFKLTLDDYTDMCVLDIGCGPRGSLEWATTAKQRVGLDPLVDSYRELGLRRYPVRRRALRYRLFIQQSGPCRRP